MDDLQNNFENVQTNADAVVVDWARENATIFLKGEIDQEAGNWHDVNLQTWKIATYNIVKRLRDSTQMGFLVNNIKRRLNIYSGNICLNIENRSQPVPVYSVKHSAPLTRVNTEYEWKEADGDIHRPRHHHQLAEDISPQQPLNTRVQAFKMLVNSQLADVASSDHWIVLQKHLVESLCDSEAEIFEYSLKIHAKLLTLSFNIMRDSFASLIEGLRSHFCRKFHKFLPILEEGLQFDNSVHYRIIKITCLIVETAKRVPEQWIRMGEKLVDEIMNIFLALITMHTYDSVNLKNVLYPFHVMAAIDPKAKWCRIWLHGGFGRKIFLLQQSRVVTLLKYIVDEITEYLTTVHESKPTAPTNVICKQSVRLAVFSHSVNILCCIAKFKKGHSFFPLSCRFKSEGVTVQEVLCFLIQYLNDCQESNFLNLKVICDALMILLRTRECPLLSLSDIFMVGLLPMKEVADQKTKVSNHKVPWHTIDILQALTKNETVVMFLMDGESMVEHNLKSPWGKVNNIDLNANCHPVSIILNYTHFLLMDRGPPERALIPLLYVCTTFFKYHDLCSILPEIPLIDSAIICLQHLKSQIKDVFHSKSESEYFKSEELGKSLLSFLTSVISHPGGLLTVVQHGLVILDLIPFLFENPDLLWETSQYRRLISMLCALQEVEDTMTVECSKPLGKILSNLWTALEDEEDFIRGIERKINEAITYYMNVVYTFTCTLYGAKIFLSEYEGSEDTLLESGDSPTTPVELIMFEHANDPWHKVALLTVQALTRNLDVWLYAESKFGIEKRLVQVQSQNVSSPLFEKPLLGECDDRYNVIIDECSLLRHRILTTRHIVSRPNQEGIPEFNTEILESYLSENCCTQVSDITDSTSNNLEGNSELQLLLDNSEVIVNSTNWIVSARKAFRLMQEDVKPSAIVALVQHISQCNANIDSVLLWVNGSSSVKRDLCAEEILGIKIAVRHGVQTGVLQVDLPNDHLLKILILQTQTVLQIEKSPAVFNGFDWFLSSVFLLCAGNLEECQNFLNNFVTLQVSVVLWPTFAESKGVHRLCIIFSSLVDMVISVSLPCASALQSSGVPWGSVCFSWLCQCFWNIFNWNQVCEWLTLCILYPPDITIYFCVTLLTYLQPKILDGLVDGCTWDQLVREHFTGFTIADQMVFLDKLIKEHRSAVLPKLLQAIEIH